MYLCCVFHYAKVEVNIYDEYQEIVIISICYLHFIQLHKLFVRPGSSDVIMVTSAWITILYVMDGMNVLTVVMSGTGTVVCDF